MTYDPLLGKCFWNSVNAKTCYYKVVGVQESNDTGKMLYNLRFVETSTGEYTEDTNIWWNKKMVEEGLRELPVKETFWILEGEEYELD
jgi:hypothetical protein